VLLRLGEGQPSWAQEKPDAAIRAATAPEQGSQGTADQAKKEAANAAPGAGSGTISESQLVGLPLNGRSYSQLATLQSGVSDPFAGSASRGTGSGGLTVAGGRPTSNSFLLDGTSIMDSDNQVPRSAAGVQLGSDAVFQVQVFSTAYGAEYGRGSGGVLNSISRSGTPQLHGTLFEYFRNSRLDARNFFDPEQKPTPFKRNQFGFTLTGPIHKETTFITGSFEALRDRLTETDTSFFVDGPARGGTLIDRQGNVKQVTVRAEVKPYLALEPLPNGELLGGGIGENRAPDFLPTTEDFFTIRVDHKITEQDSLFAHYSFDDATSHSSQITYLFHTINQTRQQYLTLVGTHIFSPASLNLVRFSYTRPVSIKDNVNVIPVDPSLYFVPEEPRLGQFSIPGLSPIGPDPQFPDVKIMNSFQLEDDFLRQRGAHGLKFGAQVHRYRWDVVGNWPKAGIWSFNSLESFLQAGPEGTSLQVALPGSDNTQAFRETLLGFYAQDEYRVNPHLQLNLGLRYEFTPLVNDAHGKTAFLADPVRDTQAQVGPLLKNNPSLRNVSPRLGFAWSPRGSRTTRIGAGAGIYYDPILEYIVHQTRSSMPFYQIVIRTNFDSSTTFPKAIDAASGVPARAQVLDYQAFSNPSVLRYNLSLQQDLPGGWRVQASYVGARGNHLGRTYEMNLIPTPIRLADGALCFPPDAAAVRPQDLSLNPACQPVSSQRAGPVNPSFSSIFLMASDAQSFYNSLQLSAGKTVAASLSLQANYTFSKSVDDASVLTNAEATSTQYGFLRTLDRGLSDFDIRHRLVFNFFYTLPFGSGPGGPHGGVVSRLFGGWRVGGILSFRNGVPFTPQVSVKRPGYLFDASRPNLLPGRSNNPTTGRSEGCSGVAVGEKLGGRDRYFDPCAFDVPAPGTVGNLGRNTVIAANVLTLDLTLQRDFLLDSKRRLQFRSEFFNLANHTNLNRSIGSTLVLFSGASGQRSPNGARIGSTATTARQLQFALRLSF